MSAAARAGTPRTATGSVTKRVFLGFHHHGFRVKGTGDSDVFLRLLLWLLEATDCSLDHGGHHQRDGDAGCGRSLCLSFRLSSLMIAEGCSFRLPTLVAALKCLVLNTNLLLKWCSIIVLLSSTVGGAHWGLHSGSLS